MSSNIDFKALWQQQEAAARPHINEVIKKAKGVKRKTRNKLLWLNLALIATILLYIFVPGFTLSTSMVTTKIGAALVILGIVFFLTLNNRLLLSLFKTKPETDTFSFLTDLLQIRKKQEFIQTRAMNLYFLFLSAGMFLYMIEFVQKMGFTLGCVAYVSLLGWLAVVYFYIKPRTVKKQKAEMNAAIERLQAINDQLTMTKELE
ncbi:hypothetical protein [Mucilaginibacter dorajii]|uniref:Uncharacterized protein n=1 Tax=Mucilaginibacter dorajii TaxID=692994 RepID=A0ABP7QVM4_9SPHI|nr:hypothetical protein [Mucilaginibacter dorajii]MCS3735698.1 putative membrane protein [Mucilaginibacter dorajii]